MAPYIKENKLILRGPQCEEMVYKFLNLYRFTYDCGFAESSFPKIS